MIKIPFYKRSTLAVCFFATMFFLYGCTTQSSTKNNTVTSNTSETATVPKQVPSLNITIPLLPNTREKVSGWVSSGSGAEIEIDGPHGGVQAGLKTQSSGYFSDTVVIPEDMPPGTEAAVKLISNNKVVIKQRLIVGNPYTS